MLVLTMRDEGDYVRLTTPAGEEIFFRLVEGTRVRIGIDAPDEVRVARKEVVERAAWRARLVRGKGE